MGGGNHKVKWCYDHVAHAETRHGSSKAPADLGLSSSKPLLTLLPLYQLRQVSFFLDQTQQWRQTQNTHQRPPVTPSMRHRRATRSLLQATKQNRRILWVAYQEVLKTTFPMTSNLVRQSQRRHSTSEWLSCAKSTVSSPSRSSSQPRCLHSVSSVTDTQHGSVHING